ncbi:unnamed protein product [Porites evermanni]|uniref:Uncharacterized protein n=1 Tax=Porites evermanni TaxID=104178 RepID=A0ABN8LQX0_9CNID|nr:unnamed protein product [Porites evermanni]
MQIIKKILNINLDRNTANSAATVAMVKELAPYTVNNLYREYFEEVFDFTDAANCKLNKSSSGVVFNYLKSITGDTTRDMGIPNRTIDDIRKEGLNIKNYKVRITLNPVVLGVVNGAGVIVAGIGKKNNHKRKIEMTRIAFTTYEKVLVELRAALRGDEWDKQEFVDRMKLVDEMIIDQTPIADRFSSRYRKKFGLSNQ